MRKQVVIVTLLCCSAGYWIYHHFVPCTASIVMEMPMKITSSVFKDQAELPVEYTCHGKNIHPPLEFHNVPENAKSLALVMSDPDAMQPNPWIHWVIFNMPPTTQALDQDLSAVLAQAKRGENTAKTLDYYGACPPRGHGVHHYHFMLYALDTMLDLPEGSSYDALKNAMLNHIITQADLVGLYEHP
jgi:Raf kinase inhibitor-like YbhB/YbcL family protein